ncbi:MAG: MBL fold metallo-hydrolase [Oscillospiraceae bacterium]|nr:MBL fold metallo-hydrolase [Oscillospiraceae bacterium]
MIIKTIPTGAIQANSYLISSGADAVLVDCGAAEKRLLDALEGLKLHAILLTHGHWDHILGVAELKKRTGAAVVIHRLDAPRLTDPALSRAGSYGIAQEKVSGDIMPKDGEILRYGNIEIRVIHTPGHTPGGLCYRIDRSIFTGDTLFFETCGRIDFPGGDWSAMRESLFRLRDLDGDFDIYPGHDRATTLAHERVHNRYMQATNFEP